MRKKLLFWIDSSLYNFINAKFIHEKFDCDINISKHMEWELSRQIDFRKNEYNKNH